MYPKVDVLVLGRHMAIDGHRYGYSAVRFYYCWAERSALIPRGLVANLPKELPYPVNFFSASRECDVLGFSRRVSDKSLSLRFPIHW